MRNPRVKGGIAVSKKVKSEDEQPMILLHGIWMTRYAGPEKKIYAAGFKFPAQNGWGGELFNFQNFGSQHYGHVEIIQRKIKGNIVRPQLRIEALGAKKSDDKFNGALVVWTAPDPRKPGRTVIGWYKNATVYRHVQRPSGALKKARTYKGEVCTYRVEAASNDCTLLQPEKRFFTIPPKTKGKKDIPGQFGAYYPASNGMTGQKIENEIRKCIEDSSLGLSLPSKKGGRYQVDPARKREVEETAIKFVWEHFANLGYVMEDKQKDNLGYDLVASNRTETLCIEVKGRSGTDVIADFSPNEYSTILMSEKGKFSSGSYRICLVTDTLEHPLLHHFVFWRPAQDETGEWRTIDGGRQLILKPVTAARGSSPLT